MYAKVFLQIFDSSIADNVGLRHFFMDLLILADVNGVVDMTQEAISARTRIPISEVKQHLDELQKPDKRSRTDGFDGCRIKLLFAHRDWGWVILNHNYYRNLASEEQRRERTRERVRNFRAATNNSPEDSDKEACNASVRIGNDSPSVSVVGSVAGSPSEGIAKGRFSKPSVEAVKIQGAKIGLPDSECESFFDYYEANGWRVGKNPMRLWTAALANWKRHWIEHTGGVVKGQPTGDTFWKDKARLDMVDKEISAIEARASHTAMDMIVESKDKDRYVRLKAERREIKAKMKL